MNKIFKATLAVAAIAAVGMGSYKAYGSYEANSMSVEDLLLAENVEALSQGGDSESADDEIHVRGKQIGVCYARKAKGSSYSCTDKDCPKWCKCTDYTYTGTAQKKVYEYGGHIKRYLKGNCVEWKDGMDKCTHSTSRLIYCPATPPEDYTYHSSQGQY